MGRSTARLALAMLLVGAFQLAPSPATAAEVPLSTVLTFSASAGEGPEGLVVDKRGNIWFSHAFTGLVQRLAPDGTVSTITTLPVPVGIGLTLGMAVDAEGTVYAALDSFDGATQGIWRIRPSGDTERLAALDPNGFPNGLAFDHRGNLFVSDTFLGIIWRIPRGSRTAEPWLQDPLLAGDPVNGIGAGANGVAFLGEDLFVGNTDEGTVVRIPVLADGSAGAPGVYVEDAQLVGADGLAFDVRGTLYVTTDGLGNSLAAVRPDGSVATLADASDGLDYAASIAFGTTRGQQDTLFIADVGASFGSPSIMAAEVGVSGVPLP